ncbi:acyltransferase family protein [Candidatus Pelagibacter bacterium nBUS_49]|uniref:acyltransferase family protein n=1 Tax=Candidatus Pelagibacter bacterium nBUS_49 TaxID=3374196 RepID=UPI003EBA9E6E
MKYRAEIDGLRALAVLPVILFHADFKIFKGGYVGVDIFFVISGYLITSILIKDLNDETFNLAHFYERRIRRILPALVLIMIVCIPFAWMWMLPGQMKDFSQSLVAVSLFLSNILFWKENDYFDTAVEEKPLIHTWSLAVEEQYYLFFPLFLIFFWRYGERKVFFLITFIASTSLFLSEWGSRNFASANFYFAPTRVWELFAGSIAALIIQKKGVQSSQLLSFFGLLIIIITFFIYDEDTPFPSLYTLVPVIGVFLIILYANKDTLVNKILRNKFLVGIGLISYSSYLWHQPVFAFARIRFLDKLSVEVMFILIIFSFILAFISWKFVENPFRNKKFLSRKQIFIISGLIMSTFIIFGVIGHTNLGFEKRFPDDLVKTLKKADLRKKNSEKCMLNSRDGEIPKHPIKNCSLYMINNSASVMMIGDSHLDTIQLSLQEELYNLGIGTYAISYAGCIPFIGFYRTDLDNSHRCDEYNRSMINYAKSSNIKDIIFIARFPLYINGKGYNNGEGGVEYGTQDAVDLIGYPEKNIFETKNERIKRVSIAIKNQLNLLSNDFRLFIFSPVPEVGWDVPKYYSHQVRYSDKNLDIFTHSFKNYRSRTANFYKIFDTILNDRIFIYDLSHLFCDEITQRCSMNKSKDLLYRDNNHISLFASELVSEDFLNKFGNIILNK